MDEVSFKDGTGVYSVTFPEKAKFEPAAVKKAVGKFTLDRIDVKIKGDVTKDDKGVWLTSTSGMKFLLANRPKKDDKDKPPDVLAQIEEGLKGGKTTFAISGQVRESKDNPSVELQSAEVVEKKEEKR